MLFLHVTTLPYSVYKCSHPLLASRGVCLWTDVCHSPRHPCQLLASEIKQTFLPANLPCLLAFNRQAARPPHIPFSNNFGSDAFSYISTIHGEKWFLASHIWSYFSFGTKSIKQSLSYLGNFFFFFFFVSCNLTVRFVCSSSQNLYITAPHLYHPLNTNYRKCSI